MHVLIGLILSAGIGLSLGLVGGGGSIVTVPVLVYVLGVEAREAIGMSLAVVGATSLVGSWLHLRKGNVDLKTGGLFGASGVFGALAGARLTYLVTPSTLMLLFATLMFVIAGAMLLKGAGGAGLEAREVQSAKAVGAGFGVGVLTGFLGVGGGFLVVPALVFFGGLTMKDAIGTSLVVIAINCAAGLVGHLNHGGFDLRIAGLVTLLAAFGTIIGTALSHRTNPARLKTGFAVFVIAVAVFLIVENYHALL